MDIAPAATTYPFLYLNSYDSCLKTQMINTRVHFRIHALKALFLLFFWPNVIWVWQSCLIIFIFITNAKQLQSFSFCFINLFNNNARLKNHDKYV